LSGIKKLVGSSWVDIGIKKLVGSSWVNCNVYKLVGSSWVSISTQEYTDTWTCTWSQTYRENGTKRTDYRANKLVQGYYGDSEPWGLQRSLAGFDDIASKISGSEIKSVKLYLHNEHWWYTSGGTAVIGYHNHTSVPDTFSTSVDAQVWADFSSRGQAQWISMPLELGKGIRDGKYKGISLYNGDYSKKFYGVFSGAYDGKKNYREMFILAKDKIADFSKFQGNVDFDKAKDELALAIIRVQAGSTYIDPMYQNYVANCKTYSIPFGHYAYAKFISVSDAEVEANDFLNRMDKDAKFLVVDVEEITVRDIKDLIPATQRFIDVCRQAGYKVGLYAGEYFFKNYGLSAVNADFLWIAKYSSNKPGIAYDLWQYTDKGQVSGVTQNTIDLSYLGNKPLSYFTGEEPAPTPVPQPVVNPIPTPAPVYAPTGKKIFLPADNETWTVYKMNHPASKSNPDNIAGQLAPKRFGGLTYDILDSTAPDVYVIKTDSFGLVQIYGAPSTGAKIIDANAPTPKPAPQPAVTSYAVQKGDTLSGIAVKFGTTVANLKALNGLTSDLIKVGQVLKVSGSAPAPKPAPTKVYYKVVSGDTLSEIAVKYGTTVANIKSLNGLASDLIKIDQVLRVK
jgi:LysM repeat protein/GH25 family lysozyme M1 (1,4-beta-N-acetylmuramidase)